MEEGHVLTAGAEPLFFRVRLTEDEAVAFHRCHHRILFRQPFRWLAWIAVSVVSTIAVLYMAENGPEISAVLMLVCCVCFILWPLKRSWDARRHYRRHPEDYPETEVRLIPDWMSFVNVNGRGEFTWRLVDAVVNSPDGVLFVTQDRGAVLWLPARLLEGTGLRERVLDMAVSNAVRVSRG